MPRTFKILGAAYDIYAYNLYGSPSSPTVSATLTNSAGQAMSKYSYYENYYDVEYFMLGGARGDYLFTVVSSIDQNVEIWAQ